MNQRINTTGKENAGSKKSVSICVYLWLISIVFLGGCSQIETPITEPFYAQKVEPPPVQEFRWSNGKMPKTFDPAFAAAAPDTDIVRAVYEGLTDIDSKTLQPVPALAVKWSASDDNKTWTFVLRRDAKWSNGETVTAQDFARSWERLVRLGDKVPQRDLLKNIVGMDTKNILPVFADTEIDALSKSKQGMQIAEERNFNESNTAQKSAAPPNKKTLPDVKSQNDDSFGVQALNDFTLKVSLVQPDENFPALVAHTIFRPVYKNDIKSENAEINTNIVTNGAFKIVSAEREGGVALERDANYWNADKTTLEKVRFVPMENAENALAAYRAGEIDAVTNADFEPLALKLLAPYDDFRETTHGALNFYQFNLTHKPFDDRRVREALATAIERERLTDDEMDGVTKPALSFSPFDKQSKLQQNIAAAQKLLADAGFADGNNFPTVRLLVNRNNIQQRIARAVARMWKRNLNIETEIIVKDQADFENALQNGDFDLARRGVVLPTTDETTNMLVLFAPQNTVLPDEKTETKSNAAEVSSDTQILTEKSAESELNLNQTEVTENTENNSPIQQPPTAVENKTILTEQDAIAQLPAIPLYFPTSYSLVKPYVQGFDTNALDAPLLKNVVIDNNWRPANQKVISKDKN